jgi:hypothetical protein
MPPRRGAPGRRRPAHRRRVPERRWAGGVRQAAPRGGARTDMGSERAAWLRWLGTVAVLLGLVAVALVVFAAFLLYFAALFGLWP